MKRETPCDWGECPYDARSSSSCEYHCSLGVDEDEFIPDEYLDMMPCDYSGLCVGFTCSNWGNCQTTTAIKR